MSTVEAGPSGPLGPDGDAVQAAPVGETLKALAAVEDAPVAPTDVVEAQERSDSQTELATWFLRAGLAFVFVYAAVTTLTDPVAASTYFPDLVPADLVIRVLLPSFAVYEIALAAALLTKRFTYAASVLAALTLVGILVANADAFAVLFRNVAIACAALALAVQTKKTRRTGRAGRYAARR